jgi:hypothetical protein
LTLDLLIYQKSHGNEQCYLPESFYHSPPLLQKKILDECFRILKPYGLLKIQRSPTSFPQYSLFEQSGFIPKKNSSNKEETFTKEFKGSTLTTRGSILAFKEKLSHLHNNIPSFSTYGFWEAVVDYHRQHSPKQTPVLNLEKIGLFWKLFCSATTASFEKEPFFKLLTSFDQCLYTFFLTCVKVIEYFFLYFIDKLQKNQAQTYPFYKPFSMEQRLYIVEKKGEEPLDETSTTLISQELNLCCILRRSDDIRTDLDFFGTNAVIKEAFGMKNILIKALDIQALPKATFLFTIDDFSYFHIHLKDLCTIYNTYRSIFPIGFTS